MQSRGWGCQPSWGTPGWPHHDILTTASCGHQMIYKAPRALAQRGHGGSLEPYLGGHACVLGSHVLQLLGTIVSPSGEGEPRGHMEQVLQKTGSHCPQNRNSTGGPSMGSQ